jgi:hypothetical protein
MKFYVAQKRVWIIELFGVPTCRRKKPIEASQYRGIIVQQTDQIWAWSMQTRSTLCQRSTKPY